MVNEVKDRKVTEYLILHKLPLDILLEVKDHMISQVLDIQMNEGLNFDEAFHKTQKLWENEFKMTKYSAFFKEEIPIIVKRIVKAKYNAFLKKSLLLGLISFAINLIFIFWADNQEMYSALFRIQNATFVLFIFGVLAFNYKMWKYIKKDFKYKGKLFYSMYQQNIGLLIISLTAMGQITTKKGIYAYLFFRGYNQSEILYVLLTLIIPFIVQVMIIFGLINFFAHKKALARMQNFIKVTSE